jgi:hypothetical protein
MSGKTNIFVMFYRGSIEVMDDRSWMNRDSPQGLRRMDYCNGVQGFINFAISIPRNFTDGDIRCPCRKCTNLKFLHQDVVTMHLLTKGFMEDYLCWYTHEKLFVPNQSIKEWVIGSILVLATCMKLEMRTVILTGIWLWMQ